MTPGRWPRVLCAALAVAAAGGVVVPGASAQETSPPERGPEMYAAGTVLAPLSRLSTGSVSFATEVSSAGGLSAGGVWWLGRNLGVGAHGVWAPANLSLLPSTFGGVVPDDLGDADYLAGFANVVVRLPLSGPAAVVEPFASAGLGARRLGLDPIAAPEARTATDLAGTLAAGASVRSWGPVALRFELRDVLSGYDATESGEAETQNDLLVSLGLSLRP